MIKIIATKLEDKSIVLHEGQILIRLRKFFSRLCFPTVISLND